jgi:hypothetical protein
VAHSTGAPNLRTRHGGFDGHGQRLAGCPTTNVSIFHSGVLLNPEVARVNTSPERKTYRGLPRMQIHGIPRKKTGQERSCDFVFLSRLKNATPTGESWVKFQLSDANRPRYIPTICCSAIRKRKPCTKRSNESKTKRWLTWPCGVQFSLAKHCATLRDVRVRELSLHRN